MSELRQRVALMPGVRVIVHDRDTVELRTGVWHCNSMMLADDERRGILGRIILGIANGEAFEAIAGENNVPVGDVVSVVEALAERKVLVSSEDADKWNRVAHLSLPTVGMLQQDRHIPQEAILLGPPGMAAFLRTAAGDAASRFADAGQSALEAVSRGDLFQETNGLGSLDAVAPYEPWRGKLVVLLMPELNPLIAANINRLAHHVGFSFVTGAVDGPFVFVGPAVIPGVTPCFACAESRVLESLRDHALYAAYRSALGQDRVQGSVYDVIDPLQATMLSLLAWEVVNMLTTGIGFTAGKMLSVYAPTMEIVFHELLKMPACPVCSNRGAVDQPLYSDLRSYLSIHLGNHKKTAV
ncbi:MAG TPA: TOMM precursor leader peptide-binding protein [Bryobacteraceae bacterium]